MEATSFGILDADPRMVDAWDRIEGEGRDAHDLTNLAIEWTRRWVPYSTKFFCSIIVYGPLSVLVIAGLLVALF